MWEIRAPAPPDEPAYPSNAMATTGGNAAAFLATVPIGRRLVTTRLPAAGSGTEEAGKKLS
jgi:hypothetical protein